MEGETRPLVFQYEVYNKTMRAKSLESPSFFEKFGYSNLFIPQDMAKPQISAEEDVDDCSTNAPESRTISLKSECDVNINNDTTKEKSNEKPKRNVKLRSLIEKILEKNVDNEFSQRFADIEKSDEGTEVWEF